MITQASPETKLKNFRRELGVLRPLVNTLTINLKGLERVVEIEKWGEVGSYLTGMLGILGACAITRPMKSAQGNIGIISFEVPQWLVLLRNEVKRYSEHVTMLEETIIPDLEREVEARKGDGPGAA